MPRSKIKPLPPLRKKQKPGIKNFAADSPLTNMRKFWWATDWAEMWQDWYLGVAPDGTNKYKTIGNFVKARAESTHQAAFLTWLTGPPPEAGDTDPGAILYPFVKGGPQHWSKKRAEGGWMSDANTRGGWAEIRRTTHVLQKVAAVGDRVHLSMIERWEKLANQLDKDSKGVLFLPDYGSKQNYDRAKDILALYKDIQDGMDQATTAYLRSQGVNLDDLPGLVMLLASPAMSIAYGKADEIAASPESSAANALVRMLMEKAHTYKLPLPEDVKAKIVDAVSEVVPTKKREVN